MPVAVAAVFVVVVAESAVAVAAAEAVDTGVVESVVGTEVVAVVAVAGLVLELEALGLFGAVKINFNLRLKHTNALLIWGEGRRGKGRNQGNSV